MGAGRSLLQAFGRGEEIEEVRAEYVRFLKDLEGVGPSNRTKDEGLDIFSESDVASDDDSGYSDEDDDSDSEEDDCSAATGVARQRVGLLEQLGQLHRQLLVLRQEAEDEKAKISPVEHAVDVYTATGGKAFLAHGDGERNAARQESLRNQLYTARRFVGEGSKIIVCAVCRPVQMSWSSTGEGFEYSSSACGFTSAIDALCKHNRIQWVCWPGYPVPEASREGVRSKLLSDYSCAPVFLDDDLGRGFYQTMCLQVLWPLLHNCDIDPDIVGEMHEAYEAYAVANQHFLDAVSTLYEDGDVVLVYDFHLMLLPALLRRRFPDVVCGFFLRSPFPSSEFWRILPPRDDMIRGALGADLLGFNHYDYVRHFLNACTRLLGLESSPRHIEYDGRLVSLGVRPLGIDSRLFASTADVQTAAIRLLARFGSKKVLVGVDRLDAVMGIPHKLLAFESLLENHPQWRGEVVLCLVVRDPSSAAFSISKSNDVLRQQVNELVGRVSGRFGTASYCPVLYLRHPLPRDELMALYSIADCVLVTSVREGLNTSALEFIAAQTAPTPFMQVANDPTTESGHNVVSQTASLLPQLKKRHNPGVLVYSEFAACAKSLKGALLVNPFDTDETADAIRRALTMGAKKRRLRHAQLAHFVSTYHASSWSHRMLALLRQANEQSREYKQLLRLNVGYLNSAFDRAQRRLILLDYLGTLQPDQAIAQLAQPSEALLLLLEQLASDPRNDVFLITAEPKEQLQQWFGHLRIGLVAEYGYCFRMPPPAKWVDGAAELLPKHDLATKRVLTDRPTESDSPSLETSAASAGPPLELGSTAQISHKVEGADPAPPSTPVLPSLLSGSAGTPNAEWKLFRTDVDLRWRVEVIAMLEYFTDRTPGSFLNTSESFVAWHFRDADAEFGLVQAKHLQLQLEQMLAQQPVHIIMVPETRYILVRSIHIQKGKMVQRIFLQLMATSHFKVSTAFNQPSDSISTAAQCMGTSTPTPPSVATNSSPASSPTDANAGTVCTTTAVVPPNDNVAHDVVPAASTLLTPPATKEKQLQQPQQEQQASSAVAACASSAHGAEAPAATAPHGAVLPATPDAAATKPPTSLGSEASNAAGFSQDELQCRGGAPLEEDAGVKENIDAPESHDFVLCIGDDRTDEHMFKRLAAWPLNNVWSVTVGQRISHAQYYVDDTEEVLAALQCLCSANNNSSSLASTPQPAS